MLVREGNKIIVRGRDICFESNDEKPQKKKEFKSLLQMLASKIQQKTNSEISSLVKKKEQEDQKENEGQDDNKKEYYYRRNEIFGLSKKEKAKAVTDWLPYFETELKTLLKSTKDGKNEAIRQGNGVFYTAGYVDTKKSRGTYGEKDYVPPQDFYDKKTIDSVNRYLEAISKIPSCIEVSPKKDRVKKDVVSKFYTNVNEGIYTPLIFSIERKKEDDYNCVIYSLCVVNLDYNSKEKANYKGDSRVNLSFDYKDSDGKEKTEALECYFLSRVIISTTNIATLDISVPGFLRNPGTGMNEDWGTWQDRAQRDTIKYGNPIKAKVLYIHYPDGKIETLIPDGSRVENKFMKDIKYMLDRLERNVKDEDKSKIKDLYPETDEVKARYFSDYTDGRDYKKFGVQLLEDVKDDSGKTLIKKDTMISSSHVAGMPNVFYEEEVSDKVNKLERIFKKEFK